MASAILFPYFWPESFQGDIHNEYDFSQRARHSHSLFLAHTPSRKMGTRNKKGLLALFIILFSHLCMFYEKSFYRNYKNHSDAAGGNAVSVGFCGSGSAGCGAVGCAVTVEFIHMNLSKYELFFEVFSANFSG